MCYLRNFCAYFNIYSSSFPAFKRFTIYQRTICFTLFFVLKCFQLVNMHLLKKLKINLSTLLFTIDIFKVRETQEKQPPEPFYKKGVLRNFAKFTGKHLCQTLFFNKVAVLRDRTPPVAASPPGSIFFVSDVSI